MFDISIYKQILDLDMDMVLLFAVNGTIVYSNKQAKKLLDYELGLENNNISDIFPTFFSVECGRLVWNVDLDDNIKSAMAYRGNRTCFGVDVRLSACDDHPGLFICVIKDTTKRSYLEKKVTQVEQQTESAEQVKSQFVANVTHELRTPVNGILGNTKELLELETDTDKQKILKLIERGCNDMHSIINNILDFSKLNSGKFVLENREFNFRNMMEYVKSTHITKISEKGLQFFMTVSPDIPETIVGDELRIVQVLNNLLSNATKFTSTGKIAVEVLKTGQMGNKVELFFMVIDTGIGIAKEDQDKLFKSFSQVDASTTRKYGGTGLGLNISKQLVELMAGSILVESERNKGTMFSFHIWVDLPKSASASASGDVVTSYKVKIPKLSDIGGSDELWTYGSAENMEELSKKLSKLVLCVEMDNWEKAEMFMDSIKQLTADAPQPVKSAVLRLKMSVQKADYDKTIDALDKVKEII